MPIALFLAAMRNTLIILAGLVLGSAAWAVNQGMAGDPVVGPGKAGAEKDEKGRIKGAGTGGPNREFHQQFERRVDRPEEAIEKDRKAKEEKAKREGKSGSEPEFSKR
jgi:hypothetical protein